MPRWYVYGWRVAEIFTAPDIDTARGSAELRYPPGHRVAFVRIAVREGPQWAVYVEYDMAVIHAADKERASYEARRRFGSDKVARVQSVVSVEVARREAPPRPNLPPDEDGA